MPADPPGDEPPADAASPGASEAPLEDLVERVRRRRAGERADDDRSDPVADADGADRFFREESFEAVGSESLWSSLEASVAAGAEAAEATDAADEFVVSKRRYCERCPHFGEPPTAVCTHPGTTLVAFVDGGHVRVRNCPVVAERRSHGEPPEGGLTPGTFGGR